MTVHIVLMFTIIILGMVTYSTFPVTKAVNKRFIIVSMFLIFLVEALRAPSVGRDTYVYARSFELIARPGFNWRTSSWEKFYIFLNMIVAKFTDNPQIFLAVVSAIILTGIGVFIYKSMDHSYSAFWPVFFFMSFTHYLNSMNLLRQYLAMAFVLQIYWVLRDVEGIKKYITSIILLFTGMMFHSTAIVGILFAVPYLWKTIKRKTIVFIGMVGIVLIAGISTILPYVFMLFPQYTKYIGTMRMAGETGGLGVYYLVYVALKLMFIVLAFMLSPDVENNKEIYRLTFISIIAAGLILMKTKVSIAHRTGYYFDIFFILLIPEVVNRIKNDKFWIYLLLFAYAMFCFFATLDSPDRACVPYLFFWEYQY